MMMSNGTMLDVQSTFVKEGTWPAGSTWQMLPIPMQRTSSPKGGWFLTNWTFPPPCYDPTPPRALGQGICSGEWISNISKTASFLDNHTNNHNHNNNSNNNDSL